MSLKLIANYSKRLGLPQYSSHSYSVTVETEITNIDDLAAESADLYKRLQDSVDDLIRHPGFTPEDGSTNTDAHRNGGSAANGSASWQCSDKQRDLILKIIEENRLDKAEIESLSRKRFDGRGVKQLNRLQASGLIDELLEKHGATPAPAGNRYRRMPNRRAA